MCFDTAAEDHAVRFVGVFVLIDGASLNGVPQINGFHGGPDGASHGFLCHMIALQHIQLALGSGAAVAAHSREHKRLSSLCLHIIYNCLDNNGDIGDAAAAAGNRDLHAGFNIPLYGIPVQLFPDSAGNIGGFHVRMVELLTDPDHFRKRYSSAKLLDNAVFTAFKCHLSLLPC